MPAEEGKRGGEGTAAQAEEDILVELEEAAWEAPEPGLPPAPPKHRTLSLKVKVTSRREKPLPLVAPGRFRLFTPDNSVIVPSGALWREPALGTSYLKKDATVSGWVTFHVPEEAARLLLSSDFRKDALPIPTPERGNP